MAALGEFLHRLTHAMAAETLGDQSDVQLVERALTGHDPVAFQAIVQRHGPMVYRVCWRVLRRPHDCEDAFQATFLILARKLRAIRKPASLASWLHGVAHRVAHKARAHAAARERHESHARRPDNSPVESIEWQAAFDAELTRLPDRWRLPLIHCYLEGHTQDEAAKQLGWSKRTLRRRLDEARAALARRLTARGIVASTAFSGVLISDCLALAAPTTSLVAATVHAATHAVGISPAVTALIEGVLHAMVITKIKTATLVVLALGLLGLGGLAGIREVFGEAPTIKKTDGAKQTPPVAKETAARVPEGPGRESAFVVGVTNRNDRERAVERLDSAGRSRGPARLGGLGDAVSLRLSPDGKRLAFERQKPPAAGDPQGVMWVPRDLYVVDLDAGEAPHGPLFENLRCASFAWTPDGKQLYISAIPAAEEATAETVGRIVPVATRLYDFATGSAKATDLPEGHGVCDVAPDGKTVLTKTIVYQQNMSTTSYLVPLANAKPKAIAPAGDGLEYARFSPDGTRIAGIRLGNTLSKEIGLLVYDLAGSLMKVVPLPEEVVPGNLRGVAWAPDGKRIAVLWLGDAPEQPGRNIPDDPVRLQSHRITTLDPDGKNPKTIREYAVGDWVHGFDWGHLVLPARAPAPKVPDVAKRIQGKWSANTIREFGVAADPKVEELLKKHTYKIEITGEVLTLHAILDPKAANREMKYRLDLTQTPNVMEILEADKVVRRAIFELDGDDLKILLGVRPAAGDSEPKSPTDFEWGGKVGDTLLNMRREVDDRPGRLVDAMEGFRKFVPPAQGLQEHNGMSVPEIEPYIFTHLDGVAKRLGVQTKAECLVLLSYLKDPDGKIRWIAISALEKSLGAYPGGMSADMIDPGSENNRKMVLRFVELIEKLTR